MVNAKLELTEKDYFDFYGSLIKKRAWSLSDAQIEAYVEKKKKNDFPAMLQIFRMINGVMANFLSPVHYLQGEFMGQVAAIRALQGSDTNPICIISSGNYTGITSFPAPTVFNNLAGPEAQAWNANDFGNNLISIAQEGVEFFAKRIIEATIKTPGQILPRVKQSVYAAYVWKFAENAEQVQNLLETYFRQYPDANGDFWRATNADPQVLENAHPTKDQIVNVARLRFGQRPKISDPLLQQLDKVVFSKSILLQGIPKNIPGSGTITVTSNDGKSVEINAKDIERALGKKYKKGKSKYYDE